MKIIQTILLIEDNEAMRETVEMILHSTIATIERILFAATLQEGINYLKDNGIDLVLLDLGLPDSKGLDAMRTIKQQYPKVSLVILTASHDSRLAVAAERQGVRYISKTALADGYTTMLPTEIRLAMLGIQETESDVSHRIEENFDIADITDFWRWRGQVEEQLKGTTIALQETVKILSSAQAEMRGCFTEINNRFGNLNIRVAYWAGGGAATLAAVTIIAKLLKIL
jgi:DNA-binding NarL/FixJ family response regulator